MALFPVNPGVMPLGQFDMLDTQLTSLKGGEVMTLTEAARANSSTERAAYDVQDGYLYSAAGSRPVATLATTAAEYPLFLSDDGTSPDYLTYFGRVVGSTVGLNPSGTVLGPHTAEGSGKVTLWDKPGLYVVTTDALATDFVSSESSLSGGALKAGDVLGFTNAGKLCHAECSGAVSSTGVANFVEYESNNKTGSLVTSSPGLVGATESFLRVKLWFHAGLGLRTVVT